MAHIKNKVFTSKTKSLHQKPMAHIKKAHTSKTNCLHKKQISGAHIKNELLKSKQKAEIKKQIAHDKSKSLTSKPNCSHQTQN